MNNIKKLYIKELASYFNTPLAYIIASVFLIISGYFFAQPLFLINQSDINSFIQIAPLLFSFLAPAITMRLFAEESKTGTIELLYTMPITEFEILTAKFLSSLTLMAAILFLTLVYPVTIMALGSPDTGALICSYLGLFLTAAVFLTVGIFASTLTKSQVVSFILGFLISFILYLLGKVDMFMPAWLAPITNYAGIDSHLANISKGILDLRDFIYYLSAIFMFILFAQIKLWSARNG